ncbi:MAG: class I SAM-dependent methyltransferase [Anaerolineae bacterium]|nr:class I SAM-dependent methyltransferase [Anaerolineae bacterium]
MTRFLRFWWDLIRFFFRLLYGPFAWTYDAVAWTVSLGQWTAWVRTVLGYLGGPRVLELAHGPGHLQVAMNRPGLTPIGVDLSPQMGRIAHRRLQREGMPPRLVRARAQALPFCDAAFRGVAATFPTEFIIDPQTVQEIVRVLSVPGIVVIVAGCRLPGRDPFSLFLEWLYRVTGQRGLLPQASEAAWRQSGLALRTEWVDVGRTRVLLVIGERFHDPV